jgi:hypothetical protein
MCFDDRRRKAFQQRKLFWHAFYIVGVWDFVSTLNFCVVLGSVVCTHGRRCSNWVPTAAAFRLVCGTCGSFRRTDWQHWCRIKLFDFMGACQSMFNLHLLTIPSVLSTEMFLRHRYSWPTFNQLWYGKFQEWNYITHWVSPFFVYRSEIWTLRKKV